MKKFWIIALLAMILPGHLRGDELTKQERNKQTIQMNYTKISAGKWREAVLASYGGDDVKNHGYIIGQKRMLDAVEDIFRTFPDYQQEILEMVAEGNTVVVRAKVSGTWKGKGKQLFTFGGREPNGKHYVIQAIHWYTFNDEGKIIGHRAGRDDVLMLSQLGLFEYSQFTRQPIQIIQ